MKRAGAIAVSLILILVGGLLVRAALHTAPAAIPTTQAPFVLDEVAAAERLAAGVRLKTISFPDPAQRDYSQWLALHQLLQQQFPRVHKSLRREVVAKYSLLYTWTGTDPSLAPMAFLAHQDVVPIAPGTEDKWSEDPFKGVVRGGFLWGRGALDDKAGLFGQMEAVERLLAEGFTPKRTLYFAFGHDEEIGGREGAGAIAALLKERNVKLEAVIDEGGFVARGAIPEVKRPVALVGVAEKGYVSITLQVQEVGGHSSMPPTRTAIGRLAAAVSRLETQRPAARLQSPTREMLVTLGPEMGLSKRVALANLWLFEPLLLGMLSESPPTDAAIRTTTAPTIFQAGVKDNVLPALAKAVVNFRLLPGDTPDSLEAHVRRTIQDEGITLTREVHGEASPISDTGATPYLTLKQVIGETFEGAIVTPFLTLGGTDTKHYLPLTQNTYRFLPLPLGPEDTPRIHGIDERIAVSDYAQGVYFYHRALSRLANPSGP